MLPVARLEKATEQVTHLLLLVEVGRLELHVACLLRPRSGAYKHSDLRFLARSVSAPARCCPRFALSAADPARTGRLRSRVRQGWKVREYAEFGGDPLKGAVAEGGEPGGHPGHGWPKRGKLPRVAPGHL
jgi:hypothetical protein